MASREQGREDRGRRSEESAWQSNADTEVILRAYALWGRECLRHLRGMFAFALWDANREELFLARDPFGIKPLYYYQTGHLFLFASEVRALLASGLVPRRLSAEGLSSYLNYGSVQDSLTIIAGVRSLLPGHCLVVKLKNERLQVEVSPYAKGLFESTASPQASTRSEAVEILRAKLEESVQLHLVSDRPVAAFLSGGIDSCAIVGLMSRVTDVRPKTFSVIFDETALSEVSYSWLVAKKFGTEHTEIPLSEQGLLAMLPDALGAMDQPTMDGINTYVISKAVKEAGVTVALSGLGGDELFAGYPSFRRAMQLSRLTRAPYGLRKTASIAGRALSNGSVRLKKFWDMVESNCSPHAAYAISRRLFAPAEVDILTNGVRGQSSQVSNFEFRISKFEIGVPPDADVINAVSRCELAGYMRNTLLRDTDQMSMAHSLEVRVPFVDVEVVRFVLGLPGEWKMDGRRPKPLLLDALGDLLPREISHRPKMGFILPFDRWMHFTLESELDEVLGEEKGLASLGVNPEFARRVWQMFKASSRKERWARPWALYVLKKWCERNNVS